MLRQQLEERWLRWWKKVGATGNGRAVFETIAAYHTETHRAYHNLHHLAHCFEEYDRARHLASHTLILELAIWFHDIVCDPYAPDNEERSAEFARRICAHAKLGDHFGELVANLIRATKHTHEIRGGKNERLLLDIDLAILGQPPARFAEYEREIQAEYPWMKEDEYREGRSKILLDFLRRPSIYRNAYFRERYEAQARDNLKASLLVLEKK